MRRVGGSSWRTAWRNTSRAANSSRAASRDSSANSRPHGAQRRWLARLYDVELATMKQLEIQRVNEEQMRRAINRVGLKRDAVDALLREKELRVLSMESGHSGTVVRVLEPPRPPTNKIWPSAGIVLTAFGLLGALAGLGLAVIGEFRSGISGRVELVKPFRSAAAVALRAAEASGLFDFLERGEPGRHNVLRVLMYHRIADPSNTSLDPTLISASPDAFERQMRCLAGRHRFVSMSEVLHCCRNRVSGYRLGRCSSPSTTPTPTSRKKPGRFSRSWGFPSPYSSRPSFRTSRGEPFGGTASSASSRVPI